MSRILRLMALCCAAAAAAVGRMLRGGDVQDTGHLRVHVDHTVVDHAATRLHGLLPRASYRDSGLHAALDHHHHGPDAPLPLGVDAPSGLGADGGRPADRAPLHAALPHRAQDAALRHRLAGGAVVGGAAAAGGIPVRLRRVVRLVVQPRYAASGSDVGGDAGPLPLAHEHHTPPLYRTPHVELPPPLPHIDTHHAGGDASGDGTCPRGGLLRADDALRRDGERAGHALGAGRGAGRGAASPTGGCTCGT